MNGAGRGRGDFRNSSPVRIHAQPRAEIESSLAVIFYMASCGISLTTMLRPVALQSKSKRFLAAYGVPWKSTTPQRERIPPGELSLQPVAVGADDRSTDIVRNTSMEPVTSTLPSYRPRATVPRKDCHRAATIP